MSATVESRWVAGPRNPPAGTAAVRVFSFSHAGGGSTFFRPWRAGLAPDIDLRSVVLPGRESRVRELPYRRMEQLLDPLCEALEPYLDRPYAFFGHSLGALLAFEVARRFSGHPGGGPALLMVSGRRAPRLPTARRPFSTLTDHEFLTAVADLGGTPAEVLEESQLLRLFLPTLRADFELNESYRPQPGPALRCPVTAYMGSVDPEVNRAELLAWGEETSGEFTMRVFPGGHFYLKEPGNDVVATLRQDLLRVVGRPVG